ncbi:glycoside hydrolase [Exidia glandulosa HHB12029]|uniref:Glycoside hydrolase n=1 Tax=Exidia glandulosa HHB12029 TaxID=1314781 RepID=A0A166B6R0_EXIGL|nr:glycoside hydrolase [Exidia glandulosa HHB12029]
MAIFRHFALVPLAFLCAAARAFNISRTDNIMAQWGEISFENSLATYCDGTVDLFTLGWLHYSPTALPSFASPTIPGASCTGAVFPNSQLADCPTLSTDITACQSKGVAVLLALDPGSGAVTDWYTSQASARAYADQLWNLFLGGTSNTRPFGDAVLDGILVQAPDAHITTGNIEGFPAFFDQMRLHAPIAYGSKPYILAARMICPVLDENALSAALNTTSLDVVQISVAGHDSLCSVAHYDNKTMWNFDRWDRWATSFSLNKGVKLYLDVPSYSDGYNSYVNATRVAQIANETHMHYPNTFGGVSYWDSAHAVQNDGFNVALRDALRLPEQLPSASPSGSQSITSPPDPTIGIPAETKSTAEKAISPILILSVAIPVTAVAAFILLATFWLRSRKTRRESQIRPYGRRRLKHLGVQGTGQIPAKPSSGEGVSSPPHKTFL